MRFRLAAVTTVLLGALALTAMPATGQVQQDHWSGKWRYTADRGKTFGVLTLKLAPDDVSLRGDYVSDTSGSLKGKLYDSDGILGGRQKFGPVFCGNFRDEAGTYKNAGKFCVTLRADLEHFDGWYKPCRVGCDTLRWRATRL